MSIWRPACFVAVSVLALTIGPAASPRSADFATIDPANAFKPVIVGPGYVENTARQVVRTPGDIVYIFAADDTAQRTGAGPGVIRAWKGNVAGIPTAFAEVDGAHRPVAAGTSTNVLIDVDARLDRAGIVHVVYVDETNSSLYYRTFSTINDTWGPPTVIATGVNVPDGYYKNIKRSKNAVSLTLDGGDVPNIVYISGNSILYRNRNGGTWGAPELVANGNYPVHPQLAFGPDGTLHLSWLDDSATPAVEYSQRPPGGSWRPPELIDNSDVQDNSTGDQGPSIIVTSSGTPYVLWISPRGLSGVRTKYRTAGVWVSDTIPVNLYTHAPQIYAQNNDIYAFLGHDSQIRFGYQYHLSGQPWADYVPLTTLADGRIDGSASVRWDPPRDNNPNVIDAAFFDEDKYDDATTYLPQLYYMGVLPARPPAPGDTTPPTVSLTAPTPGATVSGVVNATANAADNVGVAGVQFQVDGINVGAEDTTAPYGASWDSTTVPNGSHTVSAIARDAAGNRSAPSSVAVTVSNAGAPRPSGLVAAYSFDAGAGTTLADLSGNGNNGTISGATWTAAGKYGGALSFNGSSSWVTVADANSLDLTNGMTLEAWVNPAALGSSWRSVVFKERPGGVVYSLYAHQGSVPVGQVYLGGEQNALGTAAVPLNTWTHLAVTFDGASLRLYVNGALVRTTAVAGSMAASTGVLRLGGDSIWPEWFQGLIDEVRIYNRALTASEIQTDLATPVGGPAPPPDTTAPTVSITAPSAGATVSGPVTVTANASDNVGVAGVQFKLDGANLGAEDTSAPYSVSWDTTTAANGSHSLTATARDATGNPATATAVSVTVSNVAPPPPPQGLVAAYSFNAGVGTTLADLSGNGNNGAISGATWTASGKYGGALSFNGASSWVTVADASSLDLTNGMTLEAWVDPSALGGSWRTVLFKERPGGVVYSLYAHQGSAPVGQVYLGGEQNALGTAAVPLNVWTHLAVTFDGASLRLYVNGVLVRTTAVAGSMAASTGVLRLGGDSIWPEWFQGLIDEVRVYNRALTASEIQTDMNKPVG